jgi:sulfur carrier protein
MTLSVLVNGEPRELPAGATVASVVEAITGRAEGRGVAVALAGEVIPRGAWTETQIEDGARLEVVAAVQGG